MIMLTAKNAVHQVENLIQHYPKLSILESNDKRFRLQGEITVYRTASGFILDRCYKIEIDIPIDSPELPSVIDLDKVIDDSYPHRYANGKLCLETDAIIRLRFIDGLGLIEWAEEFVETYFFSYEYYTRYGIFPFGERLHGISGIIDTYQELFQESNIKKVVSLMRYCADEAYRGHTTCPCGSGKKLRQCHGSVLLSYMRDSRKKEVVHMDVEMIRKALLTYESARKN